TGRPKGVMVEHRNVIRLVKDTTYHPFERGERILQTGAPVFDACTFEIWGALLNGLSLYITDHFTLIDPDKLGAMIRTSGITTMWLTSPLFNQLAQQQLALFEPLRYLLVGGDVLSPKHIQAVQAQCPQLRITNGYGPTENTTFSCCHAIKAEEAKTGASIPIGKPISGSTAYIVDRGGRLLPVGAVGELWVGGEGVSRGYLHDEERTRETFIPDPFAAGKRIYRTGDLAKWQPDGTLVFMGRMDHQVKIRGFRLEIGEIEQVLIKHEGIREAVVIVKESEDEAKQLVAYLACAEEIQEQELQQYAVKQLPEYMVPACWVRLEKLPLTPNGKVDRQALPEPKWTREDEQIDTPFHNDRESLIASIWESLLQVPKGSISRKDNFFERGGHSLLAMQMVSQLGQYGWNVSIQHVFQAQTPATLAEILHKQEQTVEDKIRDFALAENVLSELLRRPCRFRTYSVAERDERVLFIGRDGSSSSTNDGDMRPVRAWIRWKLDAALHPHHIVVGDEDFSPNDENEAEWGTYLNLRSGCEDAELDVMLADVCNMQEQLAACLMAEGIEQEYEPSPSQRYHMKHSDVSGTYLVFDHAIDELRLRDALQLTIQQEAVMRSRWATAEHERAAHKGCWQLYRAPKSLLLPTLDLTPFTRTVQSHILKQLMARFFIKPYHLTDSMLYRLLWVKLNERESVLLLPFSHMLFDYMSSEVLRNAILTRYEELHTETDRKSEKPNKPEKANAYLRFIEQIRKGPQHTHDSELYEKFEIDLFQQSVNELNARVQNGSFDTSTVVYVELDVRQEKEEPDATWMWEKALDVYTAFFETYLGLSVVPTWLTHYGRSYEDQTFYEMVGECVDYLPVCLKHAHASRENAAEIKTKLDWISRHNTHFTGLIYDESIRSRFPVSGKGLHDAFQQLPINLNYLGEMKPEDGNLDGLDIGGVNSHEYDRILYMTWHHQTKLCISLILPFRESREKLEQLLRKASKARMFSS
ncbi:AMP-binding protein, partial [Marinicrinis sediminis]